MKKPIYNIFTLTARNIILSLALVSAIQAQGADGEVTTGELSAEALEGLKLQIVSPMTSGAETLTANDALERYFVIDGSNVIVHLNGLAEGQHRLTVKMQYGTQVEVLAIFDLIVPANLEEGDDEREVQISAVETIGGGSGSQITVDQEIIEDSTNPVAGGAVYGALEGKADKSELPDMSNYATQQDLSDGLAGKQNAGTYADGTVYTVGESGEEGSEVQNVAKVHAHGVELSDTCVATGLNAVAEGDGTIASGDYSHAEGDGTNASGDRSHAEGEGTNASGYDSHAEGNSTTASGGSSHAEGDSTTANAENSHAEGSGTIASGLASHAEGIDTQANGDYSHAEGENTIAGSQHQHVSGRYNIVDENDTYAFIVGNGTNDENRSNAFAIDWNGNLVLFNSGTPVVLTPAKLATLIA